MNNSFYIKYLNNQPVVMNTHINNERTAPRAFPIETVAHMIAAYRTAVAPLLDDSSIAQLTLHLPDGFTRADYPGIDKNFFASLDDLTDSTLDPGCPLSELGSLESNSRKPLVIKSNSRYCLCSYSRNPAKTIIVRAKQE